jgi:IQ and ubiquitin-like domain-containing protein
VFLSLLDRQESRDIIVEIERNNLRKPYLGGVRHRVTGVEYHHASAQTIPPQRPDKGIMRYCRDTQTIQSRHRVIQTTNEQSTQMNKPGYHVSTDNDRLLTPQRYQTADEKFDILNKKVGSERVRVNNVFDHRF